MANTLSLATSPGSIILHSAHHQLSVPPMMVCPRRWLFFVETLLLFNTIVAVTWSSYQNGLLVFLFSGGWRRDDDTLESCVTCLYIALFLIVSFNDLDPRAIEVHRVIVIISVVIVIDVCYLITKLMIYLGSWATWCRTVATERLRFEKLRLVLLVWRWDVPHDALVRLDRAGIYATTFCARWENSCLLPCIIPCSTGMTAAESSLMSHCSLHAPVVGVKKYKFLIVICDSQRCGHLLNIVIKLS